MLIDSDSIIGLEIGKLELTVGQIMSSIYGYGYLLQQVNLRIFCGHEVDWALLDRIPIRPDRYISPPSLVSLIIVFVVLTLAEL